MRIQVLIIPGSYLFQNIKTIVNVKCIMSCPKKTYRSVLLYVEPGFCLYCLQAMAGLDQGPAYLIHLLLFGLAFIGGHQAVRHLQQCRYYIKAVGSGGTGPGSRISHPSPLLRIGFHRPPSRRQAPATMSPIYTGLQAEQGSTYLIHLLLFGLAFIGRHHTVRHLQQCRHYIQAGKRRVPHISSISSFG
jgi:hypothetical protein